MAKFNLFQPFLDRLTQILSNKKDKKRDIEVISEFEKSLDTLSDKRDQIKKEFDEFTTAFKVQIASTSLQIQKGNKSEYLTDNLKFLEIRRQKIEKGYIEDLKDAVLQYNEIAEKYTEFKEVFLKAHELKYKENLKSSLGRSRDSMPQINEKDIDSFLLHFSGKSKNAKVTKTKMILKDLKPSQKDFDEDKVISGLSTKNWKTRNYIVSKDGYLLDGHHSWASGMEINEDEEVSVYKVNLPIKELIRRSNLLKISTKKDVNDNLVKSFFSDFIESDLEMFETLSEKLLVINSDGYKKLCKGEGVEEGDLIKGDLDLVEVNKDNFQKDVKFIIKGEETKCLIYYYCTELVSDEVIEKAEVDKKKSKFEKVMSEWKSGTLKTTEGDIVTSQKQAISIAYSESDLSKGEVEEDKVLKQLIVIEKKIEKTESSKEEVSKGIENTSKTKNKCYSDIIIQNKDGRVLFLKRSGNDTFGAGEYSLPGGSIEANETPEAAVKREVSEETALDIKNLKFIKKIEDKDNQTESNYFYSDFEDDVVILDEKEHDNYIWANKEEWNSLDLLMDLKDRMNSLFEKKDIITKSDVDKEKHKILVIKGNELVKGFDSITTECADSSDCITTMEKSLGYHFEDLPKPIKDKLNKLITDKFPE